MNQNTTQHRGYRVTANPTRNRKRWDVMVTSPTVGSILVYDRCRSKGEAVRLGCLTVDLRLDLERGAA